VRAREKAEKTLGAKFNIRAFRDEMLNGGAIPLDLLRRGLAQFVRMILLPPHESSGR
jgi:uncharacterized protein (DUF885 family)